MIDPHIHDRSTIAANNVPQFNIRTCPALLDKDKATKGAGKSDSSDSPDKKRAKIDNHDEKDDRVEQNRKEPFRPPYVPDLYVGCLEGLEGEEGMSILVSQ